MRRSILLLAAMATLLSACAGTRTIAPPPSSGPPLSTPGMKLLVLKAVGGHLDYCDPDIFPVGHGTPLESAEARLPQIQADATTYAAILAFERIPAGAALTSTQKIAINQDYKQIQAFDLTPSGDAFAFTVYTPSKGDPGSNVSRSGTVERSGVVHLDEPGPGRPLPCPICLAAGTLIATPSGPVPVQDLRVRMAVWTTDAAGRRVAGTVLDTGSTVAPVGHQVVRLVLADGRTLLASPGHPSADGRPIGSLRPGDRMDRSVVVRATRLPYLGASTFDLLPSGPTGTYFANGILVGSTLAPVMPYPGAGTR